MCFLDAQRSLEGPKKRVREVDTGNRKRPRLLDPTRTEREAEFWTELCHAFDKRINPVPYYPQATTGLGDCTYLPLHMDEIRYWTQVWKWSTYPWHAASMMFAKKESYLGFRQFRYDPRYIGSAQMSEDFGMLRPAFLCDRLYYKERKGFSYPVLMYQWFNGSRLPVRGKAATYVVPWKDACLICPVDTDEFRIYRKLMRKIYEANPEHFVTFFARKAVDWNIFTLSLPYLGEMAYSDEEITVDFIEERLATIDFADLPYKTILRLPENSFPSPTHFESLEGGQGKMRNMEGVSTRWLSFDNLNVDFNFDKECRIPFDLIKP